MEVNPLQPRHYQLDCINYITTPRVKLNPNDSEPTLCRCLITDPPGAGKTLESQLAAKQLITRKLATHPANSGAHYSTCVIVPRHLMMQWFNDLKSQFPNDRIVAVENRTELINSTGCDWLIISVQSLRARSSKRKIFNEPTDLDSDEYTTVTVKNDYVSLVQQQFINNHVHVCIVDESHYVKNRDAKQSAAVRKLTDIHFVPHVILLSATPITKEPDDLWHQLRIIDPHNFSSFDTYLNTYCWFTMGSYGPTQVSFRKGSTDLLEGRTTTDRWGTSVASANNGLGWMLGRTYPQIGLELPPIIPPLNSPAAIVKTPLPNNLRKAYDDVKLFWSHQISTQDGSGKAATVLTADNAMQIMHLLRALTNCEEKQQKLISYMETDPGPYLVGCFYKRSVSNVAAALTTAGYTVTTITGDTDPDKRAALAKLATGPKDVVVATIHSLSEGVDLSHMSTVFFYEEDYTPGKMYQFMSRVRRHRNTGKEFSGVEFQIDETTNEQGMFSIHFPTDSEPNPNDTPVICRYFHAANTIDERIHAVQSARSVNVRDLIKVELNS